MLNRKKEGPMEIDGRELALFNRKIAWNSIILEGFPIDMYHIMPRVVHLSRFLGNRSSGQHRHRVWEFNLILRGEMTFFWGDQSVELGSGDVFFMPPDSLHGWQMLSPDFMILGLQTSISFIGGNRFHLKRQLIDAMDGLRHHIREEHSLVQAAQEMIRLLLEGPAFYRESAHLELHSIYLALFRRLFPLGLGHDLDALDAEATMGLGGKRIAEILEYYINDNMGRPVRVSEICKRFRIGKCQIGRAHV